MSLSLLISDPFTSSAFERRRGLDMYNRSKGVHCTSSRHLYILRSACRMVLCRVVGMANSLQNWRKDHSAGAAPLAEHFCLTRRCKDGTSVGIPIFGGLM